MSGASLFASAGTTALGLVQSVLKRNAKGDSLVSFTKSTRVEPIALVDRSLVNASYMPDIMQSLSSIFTGYYLQAVSLAVNVNDINVVRLLDALNPSRDVTSASSTSIVDSINSKVSLLSMESYQGALPVASLEDGFFKTNVPGIQGSSKDVSKSVSEAVNLSVGKLIEVSISTDKGDKVTFPIMVRIISTIVDSTMLTHILGDGSRQNDSLKERYHAWRAGQLEFVKDLVLCQDLIDAHRKTLMRDGSDAYAEILNRRKNNGMVSLMSGNPSVGTASNLIVLSKDTGKALEREINGKLSDARARKRVFDNTYVMLMVVVDQEWERVTIYHRGIDLPTELSIKELKAANKGTGPDVAEILKAYTLGQSITL